MFNTYADWVDEIDADPPKPTMHPTGPSDYPAHAYLFDATPAQQLDLSQRLQAALDKLHAARS